MLKKSFFSLLGFCLICNSVFADNWTLAGHVYERASWKPVEKAKVSFVYKDGGQLDSFCDEKGEFILKPETGKEGKLVISQDGFKDYSENYRAFDSNREYNYRYISLDFDYCTINGIVRDNITNNPVKDVEITFVYENEEGKSETVKSDDAGFFTLKSASDKSGSLQLVKEGYISVTDRRTLGGAGSLNLYSYDLRPADERWKCYGKVVENVSYKTIPAEVGFVYEDGSQESFVKTDERGMFSISPKINKKGKLVVKSEDFVTIEDSFNPRGSGSESYFNVYKMAHGYWIAKGTIVDYKTFLPVEGIKVECSFEDSEDEPIVSKTDKNGYYEIKMPVDKLGFISISGAGYKNIRDTYSARGSDCIQERNYEIKKTKDVHIIAGFVEDSESKTPVHGAQVEYAPEKGEKISVTTNGEGYYYIGNAPINSKGSLKVTHSDFDEASRDAMSTNDSRQREVIDFSLTKKKE